MFCSIECRTVANEKFHQFDCGLNGDAFEKFFSIAVKASLRSFFEALFIFDGSVEELKQFLLSNNDTKDVTVFDVDVRDVEYQKHIFHVMNSLCTNEKKRSTVEKFRQAIVCTILCDFLRRHSRLNDILSNDEHAKLFMNFMFKHIQIAESNYHELYSLSPQQRHQVNEQFGVGSFPFSSLLNHSCAPNVFRLTFDGFNHVVVSREIKNGEQIFDNYG